MPLNIMPFLTSFFVLCGCPAVVYTIYRLCRPPKQLDRLRKCADNTWVLNIPPPYNTYGKTMVLHKLPDARVIMLNPIPPSQELIDTVNSVGKLSHVILTNKNDLKTLKEWGETPMMPLLCVNRDISGLPKRYTRNVEMTQTDNLTLIKHHHNIKLIPFEAFGKGLQAISIKTNDGKTILLCPEHFVEANSGCGKLPPLAKKGFRITSPLSPSKRHQMIQDLSKLTVHDILIPGRGLGVMDPFSVRQYIEDGKNHLLQLRDDWVPRWSCTQRVIKEI